MAKFANSDFTYDDADFKKLRATVKKVGIIPQKYVTSAAGKGATIVGRSIKNKVPVGETGNLKRGIKRIGERRNNKNKKVYQYTFDKNMNDIFQKPVKNPGKGRRNIAYYPASQEHGFFTRSKGNGLDYVPGYHFMSGGVEESDAKARTVIVRTVLDKVEKEWVKK